MNHLRQASLYSQELNDPSFLSSDSDPHDLSADASDAALASPTWLTQNDNASSSGADWDLSNCCTTPEIIFLSLTAGYLLLIYLLWNTTIMKPMKLIAVFVHEMSHATACWLTCGSVKAIEVYTNEGGVTKYVGGKRWFRRG
ncbi:hypothetical protein ACHAXS_010990, partial [Conticribra weissflogii]